MTKAALGFDKWLILQEQKPFTQLNLKMDTAAKLKSLKIRCFSMSDGLNIFQDRWTAFLGTEDLQLTQ